MLYAIVKIWFVLRAEITMREFFSQKVIILHFSAFSLYLVSIMIYYIFYYLWDPESEKDTNKVFFSWTIAVLISAIAQSILIYIYWNMSEKGELIESLEGAGSSANRDSKVMGGTGGYDSKHISMINHNVSYNTLSMSSRNESSMMQSNYVEVEGFDDKRPKSKTLADDA